LASALGGANLDFFGSEGDLSFSPPHFSFLYFNAAFGLKLTPVPQGAPLQILIGTAIL
jgi:hypothetical protein